MTSPYAAVVHGSGTWAQETVQNLDFLPVVKGLMGGRVRGLCRAVTNQANGAAAWC